jgi:hypothetical protein
MFKSITEAQLHQNFDAIMDEVDKMKTTFIITLTNGKMILLVPIYEYVVPEKQVDVPIELPDHVMLNLFEAAHKANMTFNDYCNQAIRDYISGKVKLNIPKKSIKKPAKKKIIK